MTTILWGKKEQTIVADKQCMYGNGRVGTVTKLYRLGGLVLGYSGSTNEFNSFREEFLRLECPSIDILSYKTKSIPKSTVLIITNLGECYEMNNKTLPDLIEDNYHAIGTGKAYALGAVYAGATLEQAVKIAGKLDTYTGITLQKIKIK